MDSIIFFILIFGGTYFVLINWTEHDPVKAVPRRALTGLDLKGRHVLRTS